MSIEAMKRIKSLLQDTKMIDSHTISAVVAECDMAILAQQSATGEPVMDVRCEGCGYMTHHREHIQFARAILALRPVQVPMNQDEAIAAIKSANISSSTTFWSIFEAGIRAAEAHHGITAQAKKETP